MDQLLISLSDVPEAGEMEEVALLGSRARSGSPRKSSP